MYIYGEVLSYSLLPFFLSSFFVLCCHSLTFFSLTFLRWWEGGVKTKASLCLMAYFKRKSKLWGNHCLNWVCLLLQTRTWVGTRALLDGCSVLQLVPPAWLLVPPSSPSSVLWRVTHSYVPWRQSSVRRRCHRQLCKACLLAVSNQCASFAKTKQKHTAILLVGEPVPSSTCWL